MSRHDSRRNTRFGEAAKPASAPTAPTADAAPVPPVAATAPIEPAPAPAAPVVTTPGGYVNTRALRTYLYEGMAYFEGDARTMLRPHAEEKVARGELEIVS